MPVKKENDMKHQKYEDYEKVMNISVCCSLMALIAALIALAVSL